MADNQKMAAVYARAGRQLAQFWDGVCTVYTLLPREQDGLCYGGETDWVERDDWAGWGTLPGHLALAQNGPAVTGAEADGSGVEMRGRLFLPAAAGRAIPAGSRVRVEQQGQVWWLDCSGAAAVYPTHAELEVRLLDKKA